MKTQYSSYFEWKTPTACGCGLPASLSERLDGATFDDLVWMSRMCPPCRRLCCLRKAALGKVFAPDRMPTPPICQSEYLFNPGATPDDGV